MIFLGPKIIKGSPEKLLSYYFIEFFNFFLRKSYYFIEFFNFLHWPKSGSDKINYFREFINLPSINLKSF